MGVINCCPESFYAHSYIPTDFVHKTAVADDRTGCRSPRYRCTEHCTQYPGYQRDAEAERIDEALKELDGSGITISVDTMNPWVLDVCLKHEIHAVNDISGLISPVYTQRLAQSGLPAFLMASRNQPGDAVGLDATLSALSGVVDRCEKAGIDNYVLDPGIGIWTPFRSVEDDWTLCRHFSEFGKFDRPASRSSLPKDFYRGSAKPSPGRSSGRQPCSHHDAALQRSVGSPDT